MPLLDKTIFKGLDKRLSALVNKSRKTISKIAKDTGVDRATIYRLMSGENKFSPTVFVLADYFKVNVEWLARGKGKKYK